MSVQIKNETKTMRKIGDLIFPVIPEVLSRESSPFISVGMGSRLRHSEMTDLSNLDSNDVNLSMKYLRLKQLYREEHDSKHDVNCRGWRSGGF